MGTHAGNWIVLNDKTGGGKIDIPCRDQEQAEWLCEKFMPTGPGSMRLPNQ